MIEGTEVVLERRARAGGEVGPKPGHRRAAGGSRLDQVWRGWHLCCVSLVSHVPSAARMHISMGGGCGQSQPVFLEPLDLVPMTVLDKLTCEPCHGSKHQARPHLAVGFVSGRAASQPQPPLPPEERCWPPHVCTPGHAHAGVPFAGLRWRLSPIPGWLLEHFMPVVTAASGAS